MNVLGAALPKLSERQPLAVRNSPTAAAELQTPNSKGPLHHTDDPQGITGYDILSYMTFHTCPLTSQIFLSLYVFFSIT